MPGQAKSGLFIGYESDQVAVQALRILHERGYDAYSLAEGVPIPENAVFLFSSDGRFASKFIATKPDTYEKRGIVPPDSAAGAVQILAIRRTQHGRPYARHHADNLAVALEIFVGHVRERPAKPKRNRREESRQRRRDERCYMAS